MAGTWSTYARLQALNPHSTFAISPEYPKSKNPLLAGDPGATHIHIPQTALDFTRTIPLSELMQAEASQTIKPHRRAKSANSSLTRTQIATQAINASPFNATATSALPLRVPQDNTYTAGLNHVHADRASRLIRQRAGWSQSASLAKRQRQREERSEKIQIYQPGIHEELVREGMNTPISPTKRATASFHSTGELDPSLASLGSVASTAITAALNPRLRSAERAAMSQKKLREFWLQVEEEKARVQAKLKERMARNAEKEERQFERMMEKLNENEDLLREITEYLSLHTADADRKKESLYQAWCQQIYGPIQDAIHQGLAERSTSSIEARRQQLFDDFLRISNRKKEGLYNDVIIERDYDPLAARASTLKISTRHLHDPLNAAAEQSEEEWKIYKTFHPDAERIHHQVKDTLPPPIWAKYKIESTPHGRYSLLQGNLHKPVGKKLVEPSASYSSEFTAVNALDHYNLDVDPMTVKKQFFPRGKRTDGYEFQSEKVDYNVISNTQPSMKVLYSPDRVLTNQLPTSPIRPLTSPNQLPPIQSPLRTPLVDSSGDEQ